MTLKQCAGSIQTLISTASSGDELAMLHVYGTCLSLLREAIYLNKIDPETESYVGENEYKIGSLVGAVERIRLAI